MRLIVMSGLAEKIADKIAESEDAMKLLIETARQFLSSGGGLSQDDWATLTNVERCAYEQAKRMVEAETAALIGDASQGSMAAARVRAVSDGGKSIRRLTLEQAAMNARDAMSKSLVKKDGSVISSEHLNG